MFIHSRLISANLRRTPRAFHRHYLNPVRPISLLNGRSVPEFVPRPPRAVVVSFPLSFSLQGENISRLIYSAPKLCRSARYPTRCRVNSALSACMRASLIFKSEKHRGETRIRGTCSSLFRWLMETVARARLRPRLAALAPSIFRRAPTATVI